MTLRDYQQRIIARTAEAYRRHRRVCLVLPTGAGKTVVAAEIARRALLKHRQTLAIVHRIELLEQMQAKLGKTAEVRMVQARDVPEGYDLIIADESHHLSCDSYLRILDANPTAWILGLTATPARLDGKPLPFDCIVEGESVRTLTDQGYLCPAETYAPSVMDVTGIPSSGADYSKTALAKALAKSIVYGDAVESYQRFAPGLPWIAYCINIEHAVKFAALMGGAPVLTHKTPDAERRDTIRALGNGVAGICNVELFTEGLDVPAAACCICLRPTKSLVLWRQMIGRILRPGKPKAVILDHAGNSHRHGLYDCDVEWSLEGKAKRTKEASVRTCPICFACHEYAPECPYCGHVYELTHREIIERKAEMARLEAAQRIESGHGPRTLYDWQAIAKQRGFRPGWAWMKFKGVI